MAYVYCHIKADDGQPFYVGMGGTKTRPYSMSHHSRSRWHRNVVAKHGVRVEIVASGLSWDSAQWWEIRWIKALKNAGYNIVNLTDGGEGVVGLKMSSEARKKMRDAKIGKPSPKKGIPLSEDVKKKISVTLKGRGPSINITEKARLFRIKKVFCETDSKEFSSVTEAAKFYGLKNIGLISAVCKGRRKTAAKGRKFRYVEAN